MKRMKRKVKKRIHFQLPKRFEVFLLVAAVFFLFLMDISQNKFIDLGQNYEVHIVESITIKAINMFWIGVILYHLCLLVLFIMAIRKPKTHHYYDSIAGMLAIVGMYIIVSGALVGYFMTDVAIPFLGLELSFITYYHIGIALQVLSMIYWSFTD